MKKTIEASLKRYAQELGPHFPLNCGNLAVAAQYALPLKIIQRYLKRDDTLLDWGCGSGHFSYLLMQEKFRVRSYAFSPADPFDIVRERAKARLNKTWQLTITDNPDPVRIPFKETSCDGVLSLGVLEHVRESGGTESGSLKEIYRLLKPGGYFFCFHFPNRYSWIEYAARTLNRLHIKKFYHHHLYTKKEILALIAESGFTVKETGLYNLLPRRMLSAAPQKLAWSSSFLSAYEGVEKLLSLIIGGLSQNYYFVLQK